LLETSNLPFFAADVMAQVDTSSPRAVVDPLPDNLTSVQPGGGVCYQVELAWGTIRRWGLKRFWPGYVRKMALLRQGDVAGAPHEVLDPRDLKFCRNRCTADWQPQDDPFAWREQIPLARWGLAEVILMGLPLAALTVAGAMLAWPWSLSALIPGVVLAWVFWFFRDPSRRVPTEAGLLVAPADGVVAEVTQVEHDDFVGGPAVRIGIFLSIFNVHINRSPSRARVIRLRYWPGKFLNALNPQSTLLNESLWIGLEEEEAPHRRIIVRQIAGLFARRIVCNLRPGEIVERGAKFGMIKLGSRTELILPAADDLEVLVKVGQVVQAGSTVFARYQAAGVER
jgi:phosphatidylserine decarboxylase